MNYRGITIKNYLLTKILPIIKKNENFITKMINSKTIKYWTKCLKVSKFPNRLNFEFSSIIILFS